MMIAKKKIPCWRSLSLVRADGYSVASREISSGLSDLGLIYPEDISFNTSSVGVSLERGIEFYASPPPQDNVVLVNVMLPPDYNDFGCYNIGFSFWETDRIPDSWVPELDKMDEIWTTSKWAVEVFKDAGHDNVRGFSLGVHSDIFYADDRPLDGPFTFLHVGGPSTRKNADMAAQAFLSVFGSNRDYRLIIKSVGPSDARLRGVDGSLIGNIGLHPSVDVIDYKVSDFELAEMYRNSNCLLYPTRGEGWGLIPFSSIACGTPTICTNATSCTEYADLSIPLDFEWSGKNTFGIYRGGNWAEPSFDDLCDKMVYVAENYETVKQHTLKGAKIIHRDFSWPSVIDKYRNRLCQILNT